MRRAGVDQATTKPSATSGEWDRTGGPKSQHAWREMQHRYVTGTFMQFVKTLKLTAAMLCNCGSRPITLRAISLDPPWLAPRITRSCSIARNVCIKCGRASAG
jgi:hypothetical protein